MEKKRFYTNCIGANAEIEMIALKKAVSLSKEIENIEQITILIHTKQNIYYIERTLGFDTIDSLFKGSKRAYSNGPILKIETLRTYPKSFGWKEKNIVLLSFGLDSKDLFKFDDDEGIKAIVAHQFMKDGVKEWAKAWNALELVGNIKATETDLPNEVVKEAFDELSVLINIQTGILNTIDNNFCKTFLKALYKYDYELDSTKIKSYLITKLGWKNKHADDVVKLIDKLNSGSYFQGGEKTGLKKHIKRWEKSVENKKK